MLKNRAITISIIFIAICLIFIIRLFTLQVSTNYWIIEAAKITERRIIDYPARGLIYDRKGEILVSNTSVYDLMVVPAEVKEMDTLEFCSLIGMPKETFVLKMEAAKRFSRRKPSVFEKQIPSEEFALIAEKLYKFQGFYAQPRMLRNYPQGIAAHVLGYIGEVNKQTIKNNPYYRQGDYIGISGVEKYYEEELRGKRGVRYVLVDVFNNEKGSFKDGALDTLPESGINLVSTIDADLQAYAERLMLGKKGSIVALEPSTGEVLAIVSAPGYNPNMLVGRIRNKNFQSLSNDSLKPLFNRSLQSVYPPGSIFKIPQALVGQQMGVLTPNTQIYCDGSIIGDHVPTGYYNLFDAIRLSSNMYFRVAVNRMIVRGVDKNPLRDAAIGLRNWNDLMSGFGLGKRLPIDFGVTQAGLLPYPELYDKYYGKNRWGYSTIYSFSIGQGELSITPLQMANIAAAIANKGYYFVPHVIKQIGDNGEKKEIYKQKVYTGIDSVHFQISIDAMQAVVDNGTARRAQIKGVEVCGKTGTVENPHGADHSVFFGFAPKNEPKIAIAVFIENAGFGGTWAAPITKLLMEKYLLGEVTLSTEEYILNKRFY
ncbi:MAG: penicillin-binding protein 2 [Luteibaculaceae bacterium]